MGGRVEMAKLKPPVFHIKIWKHPTEISTLLLLILQKSCEHRYFKHTLVVSWICILGEFLPWDENHHEQHMNNHHLGPNMFGSLSPSIKPSQIQVFLLRVELNPKGVSS